MGRPKTKNPLTQNVCVRLTEAQLEALKSEMRKRREVTYAGAARALLRDRLSQGATEPAWIGRMREIADRRKIEPDELVRRIEAFLAN